MFQFLRHLKSSITALFLLAPACVLSASSDAEFLVAYAQGGPVDLVARKLSEIGGHKVINRGGGVGTIGADAAIAVPLPTFLFTNAAGVANWQSERKKTLSDHLDLVAVLATSPAIILGRPGTSLGSLKRALANGENVSLTIPGRGTASEDCAEAIKRASTNPSSVSIEQMRSSDDITAAITNGAKVEYSCLMSGNSAQRAIDGGAVAIAITGPTKFPRFSRLPNWSQLGVNGQVLNAIVIYANKAAAPHTDSLRKLLRSEQAKKTLAPTLNAEGLDYVGK